MSRTDNNMLMQRQQERQDLWNILQAEQMVQTWLLDDVVQSTTNNQPSTPLYDVAPLLVQDIKAAFTSERIHWLQTNLLDASIGGAVQVQTKTGTAAVSVIGHLDNCTKCLYR